MFSYMDIAIKLTLGFICLILFINFSGKGNLAPMSAADQIQNYVLGGIIGGVIYNPDITILQFIIVLLIWATLVTVTRLLKLNSPEVKKMIDGNPIVIVERGKLIPENFKKANLSAQDFATRLRMNNITDIGMIKKATIEQNGQLSIVKKGDQSTGLMLIADGHIDEDALEDAGKDRAWLEAEMNKQGYQSQDELFVAEYFQGTLKCFPYE